MIVLNILYELTNSHNNYVRYIHDYFWYILIISLGNCLKKYMNIFKVLIPFTKLLFRDVVASSSHTIRVKECSSLYTLTSIVFYYFKKCLSPECFLLHHTTS